MSTNIVDLIPQELQDKIPKLYETEEQENPIVYVKLFLDGWTWYITELSIDKNICFGYIVSPFGKELGYFSLEELKSIRGKLGTWIERDLYFTPTKLLSVKEGL